MVIDNLIKQAILDKDEHKKNAYKAIKNALLLNSTSKKPKPEGKNITKPNGDTINELQISIIQSLIKQRKEAADMYLQNGRTDLAATEFKEVKYLEELLPPSVDSSRIEEFIVNNYPNGFPKSAMGTIIKEIKGVFPGVEGKIISEIVKEYINGNNNS